MKAVEQIRATTSNFSRAVRVNTKDDLHIQPRQKRVKALRRFLKLADRLQIEA